MMLANTVRKSLLPAFGRPSVLRRTPPKLWEHTATALANVIGETRRQVISEGVRPLPGAVSRALQGYFPDTLLRRCRYTVSTAGPLRLPSHRLLYGHAAATTLVDVVVFAADRSGQADLRLWVRHLTYVMQFQRWGIDEFARRYVQDRAVVEQEAAANVARFLTWQRTRGAPE